MAVTVGPFLAGFVPSPALCQRFRLLHNGRWWTWWLLLLTRSWLTQAGAAKYLLRALVAVLALLFARAQAEHPQERESFIGVADERWLVENVALRLGRLLPDDAQGIALTTVAELKAELYRQPLAFGSAKVSLTGESLVLHW